VKFKIHVPFNTRAKGNPHREPKSGKTRKVLGVETDCTLWNKIRAKEEIHE